MRATWLLLLMGWPLGVAGCRGCSCQDEPPALLTGPALEPGDPVGRLPPVDEQAVVVQVPQEVEPTPPVEHQPADRPAEPIEREPVTLARSRTGFAPEPTPAVEPGPAVPTVEPQSGMSIAPTRGPAAPSDEPPAVAAPAVTFAWLQPLDNAVTLFPHLLLRGEAPPGTRIKVAGRPSLKVSEAFAIPVKVDKEGAHQITMQVTIAGRTQTYSRAIHFIDLGRVQQFRNEVVGHRASVEELEAARAELLETVEAVAGIIPTLPAGARPELKRLAEEIREELESLGAARADLGGEIDQELAGVERLEQSAELLKPE